MSQEKCFPCVARSEIMVPHIMAAALQVIAGMITARN